MLYRMDDYNLSGVVFSREPKKLLANIKIREKANNKTITDKEVQEIYNKLAIKNNFKIDFSDVDLDSYYADAVIWGKNKEIVKGTGTTTFTPNSLCTKGAFITFLHRYAGSPSTKSSKQYSEKTPAFNTPINWALDNGIINSTTASKPDDYLTRSETVDILYKYYHKYKEPLKIVLNSNGGTTNYTKKIYYSNKIGTLPTPTRSGYDFVGWYTKSSGGSKITSTTIILKSGLYYAHWNKK